MRFKPLLKHFTTLRKYTTTPLLKMRLPYAPSTPQTTDPETTEIYNRIAARRHPRPIIPLDLALLNSPPVADGWNSFVGAIRTRTSVDPGLLELAVSRVAVLTSAVYEWNAHAPLALKGGIKAEELQAVRTIPSTAAGDADELQKSVLSDKQRAVVRYADEMTVNVKVRDETFELLRAQGFSDREVVEITTGIACYNCVSRVLVALDVNECNGTEMKSVEELVESLK
ncbi:carboxymuconolactone decarboxylase family protein [Aspergillus stella-maris]|uniref:carboxymuconolactone decarboxylase family protein n=1 Tax=Aspergillus stella-maris TaxID=1810926 RepID=UPI003CCE096E